MVCVWPIKFMLVCVVCPIRFMGGVCCLLHVLCFCVCCVVCPIMFIMAFVVCGPLRLLSALLLLLLLFGERCVQLGSCWRFFIYILYY